MQIRSLSAWATNHSARLGALAGWYQQAGGLVVALLVVPFITHRLSVAEAGLWFSFLSIISLLNLVDFGFGFAISRQVAHDLGRDREGIEVKGDFLHLPPGQAGIGVLYQASRTIYARLGGIAILLLILFYELFSHYGHLFSAAVPFQRTAWYLLGLAGIGSFGVNRFQSFLNGMGAVYLSRFLIGTYQIVLGLATLVPLFLGWGLRGMAAAAALLAGIYFCVSRSALFRHAPWLKTEAKQGTPGLGWQLLKVAAPVGFVSLGGVMVTACQVPLLAVFFGPSFVTPFYIAQKIGQAMITATLGAVLPQLPFFTRLLGAGEEKAARRLLLRTVLWLWLLLIPAMIAFYTLSPWLAHVLLHKQAYIDSTTLLLLAIDFTLLGGSVIWAQFVLASGRNPFVWSTLLNGMLNLAFIALLARRWGMAALPAASLIAGSMTNYWFVTKQGLALVRSLGQAEKNG